MGAPKSLEPERHDQDTEAARSGRTWPVIFQISFCHANMIQRHQILNAAVEILQTTSSKSSSTVLEHLRLKLKA